MQRMSNGHSALVQITLHVGQHAVPVSHMGPDFLLLKEPFSAPAGEATVVLTIDDQVQRIPVFLSHSISAGSRRVVIAEAQADALAVA